MRDESVTCGVCGRMYNASQRVSNCPHLPITDEITVPAFPPEPDRRGGDGPPGEARGETRPGAEGGGP